MVKFKKKTLYKSWDKEFTLNEVIFSVVILVAFIILGLFISGKISLAIDSKNSKYNTALQIESEDQFGYCLRTDVGDVLAYGTIKPVDTVGFEDVGYNYISVYRLKERYTMHTRTWTDSDGHTHTSHYWTWDTVFGSREELYSKEITFLGQTFPLSKINFSIPYDKTKIVKLSSNLREVYYTSETNEFTGTLFTNISNKTISDHSQFSWNITIEQFLDGQNIGKMVALVFTWIINLLLAGGCIYLFISLENDWLEDEE